MVVLYFEIQYKIPEIMQVLEFFTKKKNEEIEQIEFTPSIQISPASTLFLQCTPNDPHTASNIVINSYPSKTNRTNLQTRIQWRRFKIATDTEHTNTQLPFITGNTYRCEPADLGFYIQAKIVSYDVACSGSAQVTIGPIRLDPNVKQLIQGALYSQSLRSQVKILEKDETKNVDMFLTNRTIKLTDELSNKVLEMPYDMQQPKIEVNPKDPTKIFLRFERDDQNKVQKWLDMICQQNPNFDTQSKKSFQSQGSSGSSNRIFRTAGLVNKLEVIFLTRHSRDQFIFSLRAFVCKESIRNSAALEALENVTQMRTPADAHKFFQYMSLKTQIYRLAQLAKRFQKQLNNKIRDLEEVEQTFAVATTQYAQLLEKKARELNIDLNQSHSEIGIRREEIMGKKHFRQLQAENDRLKERIRQLVEENELKEFFSKKNNQSMMLNQTHNNPFSKKNMADSYYGPHMAYQTEEPKPQSPNVAELTKSYLNLLKQNEKLKEQRKMNLGNHSMSKDLDMVNLLESLHESDEEPTILIKKLKAENKLLKAKIQEMSEIMKKMKPQTGIKLNQSVAYQQQQDKKQKSFLVPPEQSYLSKHEASFLSVSQSNMNDSMTSEAALMALQNKVKQIGLKNREVLAENERLRGERDRYRLEYEKLKKGMNNTTYPLEYKSALSNSNYFDSEGLKQQNENLINQKNSLLRKIESLTKEASKGDVLLERKCEELTKENNYLRKENEGLKQKIQSMKLQNLSQDSNFQSNKQSDRLKKINSQLLQEIKNLKLEIERKSNPLYNSRVIELENQVNFMRKAVDKSQGVEKATQDLLIEISKLQKQVEKLNRSNSDKEAKLTSQAILIERLMNSQQQNSHSISGKDKSYSQTRNDSESNEKLKKKIKQLQEEIVMMRRSTDALNRSQDMSRQMLFYNEEQMELLKRQREMMIQQNEKLSKMCQKYCKDAREANKEVAKWKQQAFDLAKAQQAESQL